LHFSVWDILLITLVPAQATLLAYLYQPKWKAFLLSLPIPFTLAVLALGRPVDATNALALLLMVGFTHAVRLLYTRTGVPIIPAIVVSALVYCGAGAMLLPVIPTDGGTFWAAAIGAFAVSAVLYRLTPYRAEPGHRTPLPVWIKYPAIFAVILFLVCIKSWLGGFLTMFPMVGTISAYEARHSLWTICRQMPVFSMPMILMLATLRLAQPELGIGPAIILGWIVFVTGLLPLTWRMWRNDARSSGAVALTETGHARAI